MTQSPPIIYTWTDEAPALATHAFLPIIRAFAGATGVPVETRDISLAGRILAVFPDRLREDQRKLATERRTRCGAQDRGTRQRVSEEPLNNHTTCCQCSSDQKRRDNPCPAKGEQGGAKVGSVAELVEKLKNEAKVI